MLKKLPKVLFSQGYSSLKDAVPKQCEAKKKKEKTVILERECICRETFFVKMLLQNQSPANKQTKTRPAETYEVNLKQLTPPILEGITEILIYF